MGLKNKKQLAAGALFLALTVLGLTALPSQGWGKAFWKESEAGAAGKPSVAGLPSLADLVEGLKGTVVNIQVIKKVQTGPLPFFRGPRGERDPFRDFFERFFGDQVPRSSNKRDWARGWSSARKAMCLPTIMWWKEQTR